MYSPRLVYCIQYEHQQNLPLSAEYQMNPSNYKKVHHKSADKEHNFNKTYPVCGKTR